jgi:Ca2+-binding EF-hand superfamily protein
MRPFLCLAYLTACTLPAQLPLLTPGQQVPGRAAAQEPRTLPLTDADRRDPGAATPPAATQLRAVMLEYDIETSRELFWACDANSDDRLDLFEARDALQEIGDPSSPGWFRRLDTDRNGYVEWPEFDAFYSGIIKGGNPLPLCLARPRPAAADSATTTGSTARSPAERTIDLFDSNQDGGLDLGEASALLEQLGMSPAFATMLMNLDANRDSTLQADELAPAMTQFNLQLFNSTPNPAAVEMSAEWAAMDADGSGAIERLELAAALRRIDPELERWSAGILQGADKDRSQSLTAPELGKND